METETITRKRYPGAVRREQIVQAAIRLFAQKGYKDTSIKELSFRVGISEPAIIQHWGSKENIYQEIYSRWLEIKNRPMVFDIVQGSAVETLRHLFTVFVEEKSFMDEEEWMIQNAVFSRKDMADEIETAQASGNDIIKETILPVVMYGMDTKEVRSDIPASEIANIIWMWIYSGLAVEPMFPKFECPSFESLLKMIKA